MNAEVEKLPLPQPRHRWGEAVPITADRTPSGCEQTERACVICGMIKITVHPPHGFPWREWRHPKSDRQFPAEHTPPCKEQTNEGETT